MKNLWIYFIFIAFLLGAACYFSTDSILYSGLIVLIMVVDYFLLISKRFRHFSSLIERVHTSYHFIKNIYKETMDFLWTLVLACGHCPTSRGLWLNSYC